MMTRSIKIVFLLTGLTISFGAQSQIKSGNYSDGLNIAFNPKTQKVTGFYESYSGLDEETGKPKFSCIFYISGTAAKAGFSIDTYYPSDKADDLIKGEINFSDKTVSIKLSEEHGGCWNVMTFADGFSDFTLTKTANWIDIRYVETEKAFFHNDKNGGTKRKTYIVKGNIVYIDKIEGDWVHCTYFGKTTTEGWIQRGSLNK